MSSTNLIPLGDCCEIVGGSTPRTSRPEFWDGDVLWVTPKDISKLETRYVDKTTRSITREGLASCGAKVLPAGSVLLSSRAPIGLVAINTLPMATNQGFKSLVPDPDKLDAGYLASWLSMNREFLQSLGSGATFKEISKAVVARQSIPLPSLDRQRRIAGLLGAADSLRRKAVASRMRLDQVIEPVFLECFGDPAVNPFGWQAEPLTKACRCVSGSTPPKSEPRNWVGSVPWFSAKDLKSQDLYDSIDHISEAIAGTSKMRLLAPDTVVILVRGMTLQHTVPISVLRVPATINQDLKALLPSKGLEPDYLSACLQVQSARILGLVSTAAHGTKRLDTSALDAIQVTVPPVERQHEFAQITSHIRILRGRYSRLEAALDALFASLQHRAFKGEL